jgi:hypothetical protein
MVLSSYCLFSLKKEFALRHIHSRLLYQPLRWDATVLYVFCQFFHGKPADGAFPVRVPWGTQRRFPAEIHPYLTSTAARVGKPKKPPESHYLSGGSFFA